jgi:hypothetical protein
MASTENGPTQLEPPPPVAAGQRDDGGATAVAECVPTCRAFSGFDGDRVTWPGTPATRAAQVAP